MVHINLNAIHVKPSLEEPCHLQDNYMLSEHQQGINFKDSMHEELTSPDKSEKSRQYKLQD